MADPRASNREAIEERAAEWLTRKDSGRFAETDEQLLEAWLSQSSRHAVAYYRLEAAWAAANRLKVLGAGLPRPSAPEPPRKTIRVLPYAAAAASVLVTFGLYSLGDEAFHGYRYATPIGRVATLPLADGSWVTLNTDSIIRIVLTSTVRRVDLERGEAFFDVAKDRNRPFVVFASGKSVTAVGTAFAVRKEGDITRVTVAEGRVRFATPSSKAVTPVAAGEVAVVGRGGMVVIQEKPIAEVEGSLSWRHGYVVFHDTPIVEAVADLNRYNGRKIRVLDPSTAATHICGAIRTDNIDGFVRLMKREVPLVITAGSPFFQSNEVTVRPIKVPPGELTAALEDIVHRSRVQVVYRCEELKGLLTAGTSGYFTGPQALAELTQGTPVTIRTDPTGAVFVVAPKHFLGPY